jgi:hypothetical protein
MPIIIKWAIFSLLMLREPEITNIIKYLLKEVLILIGIKLFKRLGMLII